MKLSTGCFQGKDGLCLGEGYEVKTATGTGPDADDEEITVTASCSAGKKVISGGGSTGDRVGPDMDVTSGSAPSGTTGWSFSATCFSTSGGTCAGGTQTAYAICTY